MNNLPILNLNNGYILADISSQEDYEAKENYLFVKNNDNYIPATEYISGTSYYEIDWLPLPVLQGQSVTLKSIEEVTDSATGRTGSKITLSDEHSSSTPSYIIWNGLDGQGQVNTVDGEEVETGTHNVALHAIRYSSQSLTDAQQSQARLNIAAASNDVEVLKNLRVNDVSIDYTDVNPSITLTPGDLGAVHSNLTINGISITNPTTSGANINTHIIGTNISVASNAWSAVSSDSSDYYEAYPYRALTTLTGATAAMVPQVIFGYDEIQNGEIGPIVNSTTNGVYIYATTAPTNTITIPTIICFI